MRGLKFNVFRQSFRNLMADLPDGHCTAEMGEAIIRSLPLTLVQKGALQKDLAYMLEYRLKAYSASVMAERIANGEGWRHE